MLRAAKESVYPGRINDIGDGINKEAFQKNYCSIVEKIKESDSETEVYIQSILPVNHDMMINNRRNSRRTTEAINDYNEILKDIAETSGGGGKICRYWKTNDECRWGFGQAVYV